MQKIILWLIVLTIAFIVHVGIDIQAIKNQDKINKAITRCLNVINDSIKQIKEVVVPTNMVT